MAQAGNVQYDSPRDIPAIVPVFPIEKGLLLPRTQMPLNIFEERYKALVDQAMLSDRIIAITQPVDDETIDDADNSVALQTTGCLGRVTAYGEVGDGRILITLTGICRFHLVREVVSDMPFRFIEVDCEDFAEDLIEGFGEEKVDRHAVMGMFRDYLDANDMEADWEGVEEASNEILVNSLAMMSPYGIAEKQALLEADSLSLRAETLIAMTEIYLADKNSDGSAILQ